MSATCQRTPCDTRSDLNERANLSKQGVPVVASVELFDELFRTVFHSEPSSDSLYYVDEKKTEAEAAKLQGRSQSRVDDRNQNANNLSKFTCNLNNQSNHLINANSRHSINQASDNCQSHLHIKELSISGHSYPQGPNAKSRILNQPDKLAPHYFERPHSIQSSHETTSYKCQDKPSLSHCLFSSSPFEIQSHNSITDQRTKCSCNKGNDKNEILMPGLATQNKKDGIVSSKTSLQVSSKTPLPVSVRQRQHGKSKLVETSYEEDEKLKLALHHQHICTTMVNAERLQTPELSDLSPALTAAKLGLTDNLRELIQDSFVPLEHIVDERGNTCLHLAAAQNHLPCIQVIVQKGINLLKKNAFGHTARQVALRQKHLVCAQFLKAVEAAEKYKAKLAKQVDKNQRFQDIIKEKDSDISILRRQLNQNLQSVAESQSQSLPEAAIKLIHKECLQLTQSVVAVLKNLPQSAETKVLMASADSLHNKCTLWPLHSKEESVYFDLDKSLVDQQGDSGMSSCDQPASSSVAMSLTDEWDTRASHSASRSKSSCSSEIGLYI